MKKFKAESQKVLDMMINSIYTNKEIFMRELLSNASDAIDKLYFKSLNGGASGLSRSDFSINVAFDKDKRTITISDNGIGMTAEELENNLGVIAKSGSRDFKAENKEKSDDISIIGQFGVGFYSAFIVADKVEVLSKAYGSDAANLWTSSGAEGYDIKPAEKEGTGTDVILHLKPDSEEENYSDYLTEYKLKSLIKKYSDYIKYPVKMQVTHFTPTEDGKSSTQTVAVETVNSMVPLWKRNKSEITEDEYNEFYKNMFYDYENPLKVIHASMEGSVDFKALLFIPAVAPLNYYSKNFEKGLRLYTNGVMITETCKDLLPDCFGFVRGLVDCDIDLNVSRETVQNNRRLKLIANSIEKKIKSELADMLKNDREKYEKFFKAFGLQLKFGIYESWGAKADELKDLIIYRSVKQDKFVTLEEYVSAMPEDQKYIYYATGESAEAIKLLPRVEAVTAKGYDVLCFTDDVDEFAAKFMKGSGEKEFRSVSDSDLGIAGETDESEEAKKICEIFKSALGDKVEKVKVALRSDSHPVCISTEGDVSVEMEKVLNSMPNSNGSVKAQKVLEINGNHKIYEKLKSLITDEEKLKKYALVLYAEARIIEGLPLENATETTDLIAELISE